MTPLRGEFHLRNAGTQLGVRGVGERHAVVEQAERFPQREREAPDGEAKHRAA